MEEDLVKEGLKELVDEGKLIYTYFGGSLCRGSAETVGSRLSLFSSTGNPPEGGLPVFLADSRLRYNRTSYFRRRAMDTQP